MFYFDLVNDNIQEEVEAKKIKKEYPRRQSKNTLAVYKELLFYFAMFVAELTKFVFFCFHLVNDNDSNNQDEVETKKYPFRQRKGVSLVLIMLFVL